MKSKTLTEENFYDKLFKIKLWVIKNNRDIFLKYIDILSNA